MKDIVFTRKRLLPGFDGKLCKVHPITMTDGKTVVMIHTMLLLSGDDVFYDHYVSVSCDGGRSFDEPTPLTGMDTVQDGIRTHVNINSLYYNRKLDKWFVFACRLYYAGDGEPLLKNGGAYSAPVYTTFDLKTRDWDTNIRDIPMPFSCISSCPHGQVMEDAEGRMLLSFYVRGEDQLKFDAMTGLYAWGQDGLQLLRTGEPISGEGHARGLAEPSVAKLDGKYCMTIRSDEVGLLSESEDGYTFTTPEPWKWDDGSVLENYNTMQRWLRFGDCLWLAYTRKDRLNGHVFRHRAPIYAARFDAERKCLIRETEKILVPELGARLGNFYMCDLSEREVLLATAEWMQPEGCEAYGSDNSIWLVHVKETDEDTDGRNRKWG